MTESFTAVIARCTSRRSVSAEDVRAMRGATYGDAVLTRDEAAALLRLEAVLQTRAPEWSAYLIEATTDHVVRQMQPAGYVDGEGASWLMSAIGSAPTTGMVDVVAAVIETASEVPVDLVAFALAVVQRAVVSGEGVTRDGRLDPGRITAAEIALVRRVIHAAGGADGIAVSRREAEMLFAIDEALAAIASTPAWCDLFARAVGNYLTSTVLVSMPNREEVLNRQAWLDSPDPEIGLSGVIGFLARGFVGLGNLVEHVSGSVETRYAARNAAMASRIEAAAVVTEEEATWVIERLNRDGEISAAELRLLHFLRSEATAMPDDLARLVNRLPRAA